MLWLDAVATGVIIVKFLESIAMRMIVFRRALWLGFGRELTLGGVKRLAG